jgi:hypothetical protein
MALEVNEVGIRVHVADDAEPKQRMQEACADTQLTESAQAAIVDECVRRVLQALKAKGER